MAYDMILADRVRELLAPRRDVTERRMFGGLAFLIGGHMTVCVSGQGGLMVRVPPEETAAALEESGAEPMVMSGREVRGWLRVAAGAVEDDVVLRDWVDRGVAYGEILPPKQ